MVKIIEYKTELKSYFESLNREWLEKYFSIEPIDREYFNDPQVMIIDKGGFIFFAECQQQIVGTCSLLKHSDHWELGKMSVTESFKGRGIGHELIKTVINRAKENGATELRLITNSTLLPAIHLYESYGFQITFRGQDPTFSRGDLEMRLRL